MTEIVAAVMATFDAQPEEVMALETSVRMVLQHVEDAGMIIVPAVSALSSDFYTFEDSVLAHLTPSTDAARVSDLDSSDVNGEAVIHDLRSKGWTIYPPK